MGHLIMDHRVSGCFGTRLAPARRRHCFLFPVSTIEKTFIVMRIAEIKLTDRMTAYPVIVLSPAQSALFPNSLRSGGS